MSDLTSFRLYQDTRYAVEPWPFTEDWRAVVAEMPAELPNGTADFAQFCPDDHYNRTHGPLAHAHSSVRSEMAVYRAGEALIILMRLWDGTPLPERYAKMNGDGANVLFMADTQSDEALYIGIDPDGNSLALHWNGLQPDSSNTKMGTPMAPAVCYEATACRSEGCWSAGFRVPLVSIPGINGVSETIAFTCGRLWGEDFEHSAWATSLVWAPQPAEMGTLYLVGQQRTERLYLRRADLAYDAETETGELTLTIGGLTEGEAPLVKVTLNTHATPPATPLDGTGNTVSLPWALENGSNYLMVQVGESRTVTFNCEKWSGHHLFPKYPSSHPLPEMESLKAHFRAWHEAKEKIYIEPGIWSNLIMKAYGYDHNCAFIMEPYALACLYLDRQPIYLQRIQEACERLVREQSPNGVFLCYHFSPNPQPFEGGAFGHGSASEALCLGYRVFGDERYLEATKRAASVYHLYALENNTNYMAFVLWHLSELYELTGETEHLDRAVWYAKYGIIRGMNPSGAYPGHNYYTAYGNITLKGLAKLLRVLPAEHEFYPVLKERTLRFTNQILSRQRASGLFDGCNRMYFGYQHSVPGLYEVLRALPDTVSALEPVLIAMLNAQPAFSYQPEGLDVALMARYLVEHAAVRQ
ncbi:MAG: hypothetical protein BWY76_01346 [bacterium ADurb.Bin429]|nr:MAG: hypothetical protein BWY76_01346 [bacterium ADurb.Bin429]